MYSLCESFMAFKDVDKISVGCCGFRVSNIQICVIWILLKTHFNTDRQLDSMIASLFA